MVHSFDAGGHRILQVSFERYELEYSGKQIEYYLITRRSWKKGGTRYNARGLTSKGHVANFC